MRHLEKHRKKQLTITVIILSLIFFITLYLFFTLGIKLLLSTSTFINNLTHKKNEIPFSKQEEIYASVDIDNIPSATNSAKIIVDGSVFNLNLVEFYLNGEKVKETTLFSSDNFSEEVGELKKGENEVYVKAKSEDGKIIKQSKKYTVFFKPEKPKLEIKEPKDKTTTSQQEIKIKGSTDKEIFIKVNDLPIVVDAMGNFETSLNLKEGENQIKIVAEDYAGNIEEKFITVIYQK